MAIKRARFRKNKLTIFVCSVGLVRHYKTILNGVALISFMISTSGFSDGKIKCTNLKISYIYNVYMYFRFPMQTLSEKTKLAHT